MTIKILTRQDLQEILTQQRHFLTASIEKIVKTATPRLVPIVTNIGTGNKNDMLIRRQIDALKSSLDEKCNEVALLRAQITEMAIHQREMEQELATLRQQQGVPLALRPDGEEMSEKEITENVARISLIITEVGHEQCPKLAKRCANKTEVYEQVMEKIGRDRASEESDIYRRNYCLMLHLTRRKAYSKAAKNMLIELWKLFSISGDIVAFSGRMFDRDYLNPRSDKFLKYVTFLVFLLKYQKLSEPVTKHPDICDSDEYFWKYW